MIEQLGDRHARARLHDPSVAVELDPLQLRGLEDEPICKLRGVAVGAPHAADDRACARLAAGEHLA